MGIIYNDVSEPYKGIPIPYNELPATSSFLKHFSNYLYLKFIFENTPDRVEKNQADHEMGIADKKMAYWKKHPNFDKDLADKGMSEEKRKWK